MIPTNRTFTMLGISSHVNVVNNIQLQVGILTSESGGASRRTSLSTASLILHFNDAECTRCPRDQTNLGRLMPHNCRCIQSKDLRTGKVGATQGQNVRMESFEARGFDSPTSKSALWAHHHPVIQGALAGLGLVVQCTVLVLYCTRPVSTVIGSIMLSNPLPMQRSHH